MPSATIVEEDIAGRQTVEGMRRGNPEGRNIGLNAATIVLIDRKKVWRTPQRESLD